MGTQQQFCLRWNNHQVNLLNVFDSLLQNESFVDVTLACDGLSLKAHKVVLSACSPYFQKLLLDNPCAHPIVILKDVNYEDLKVLVDFMYKGEVNILQDQLQELLKTAALLKISGLCSPMTATLDVNINERNTTTKEVDSEIIKLSATVTPVMPETATSSRSPRKKCKRVKREHKSGSPNSENDDSVLEMNRPPEVIESRVDVPQSSENCNECSRSAWCNITNVTCIPKEEFDSDNELDPGIPEQSTQEEFDQEDGPMNPPTLLEMTMDYSSPSLNHQCKSPPPTECSSDLSDRKCNLRQKQLPSSSPIHKNPQLFLTSGQENKLEQEALLSKSIRNVHPEDENTSFQRKTMESLSYLMEKINSMHTNVEMLLHASHLPKKLEANNIGLEYPVKWPLKTINDVELMENFLKNPDNVPPTVLRLSTSYGGNGFNATSTCNRMMRELFTDDLAALFSLRGLGEKRPFDHLRLKDVIIGAVRKLFPDVLDVQLESVITWWLEDASEQSESSESTEEEEQDNSE